MPCRMASRENNTCNHKQKKFYDFVISDVLVFNCTLKCTYVKFCTGPMPAP